MVKDRRVQQMYVEGKCVKGVCMCVIESCVTMRAYVCACVCVRCVATCQRHIGAKQTDMLSINEKHLPCLRASLFFVVVDRGIKIVSLAPQAWQQR